MEASKNSVNFGSAVRIETDFIDGSAVIFGSVKYEKDVIYESDVIHESYVVVVLHHIYGRYCKKYCLVCKVN
jgi:hypothetical protein